MLPFHPQPKPNRFARKAGERKGRREAREAREQHRRKIYHMDGGRCRSCSRRVYLKIADAPHELAVGHVHEWLPRSLGGNPLDVFNCLLLCSECHPKIQGDVGGRELLLVAHNAVRLMRGTVDTIPFGPISLLLKG